MNSEAPSAKKYLWRDPIVHVCNKESNLLRVGKGPRPVGLPSSHISITAVNGGHHDIGDQIPFIWWMEDVIKTQVQFCTILVIYPVSAAIITYEAHIPARHT